MLKAFRISFALKNTYRVNSILYSLKQIPLVKHLLPDALYKSRGLKIFGNVLSGIWEVLSAFIGKALYLFLMVAGIGVLYEQAPADGVFLHILFFLTLIGAFMNTYMFNPTNDKYYAMILMRMDARAYTLSNYAYTMGKTLIGFLPFTMLVGWLRGVPVWIGLLLPLFIVGTKLFAAWLFLLRYKRTGRCTNENLPPKVLWPLVGILLAAAYVLPAVGWVLPVPAVLAAAGLLTAAGVYAAAGIARFDAYGEMYRLLLAEKRSGLDVNRTVAKAVEEQSRKAISQEAGITSGRKGFAYFNDLFVKRHKKILWRPAKRVAAVCLALLIGMLLLFRLRPSVMERTNELLLSFLPFFTFVMYCINRGTAFTQALFMNCDHSMLTYSFYKKPRFILKLFQIRLWEIVKINLLPALVIGPGLSLLLFCSGGTANPLYYAVMPAAVLSMSVFFSVHYLTIYYLLQPYNAGTEMKSGTYRVVTGVTYFVCFAFMQVRMETLSFGLIAIGFCLAYCLVACLLVYKLAPTTFRLRS